MPDLATFVRPELRSDLGTVIDAVSASFKAPLTSHLQALQLAPAHERQCACEAFEFASPELRAEAKAFRDGQHQPSIMPSSRELF